MIQDSEVAAVGVSALRKIQRRLVWIIMLASLVAMMDRLNLSYAALGMTADIGLTPSALGLGSSLFFVAFLFAEIPSNLIMWRVGARRWIARIMVSWGLVSGAMAFIQDTTQFYILRFLLGVAEAGFLPGMLLYLSLWAPDAQRGRFNSYLLFAIPVAGAITAIVSGLIMQLHGLWGMAGWRLVFLFEAVPAVVLGFVIFFYLHDRPGQARWLSDPEKAWLQAELDREAPKAAHGAGLAALVATFRRPQVLGLSASYFALNLGVATLIWTPQILQPVGLSVSGIAVAAGALNAAAAAAMIFWARRSDRRLERGGHFLGATILSAGGFVLASVGQGSSGAVIIGLGLASAGAFAALAIFWTAPQAILPPEERPGGLAAISLIGITAGMLGPLVVGALRESSGGYGGALLIAAVGVFAGGLGFLRVMGRARNSVSEVSLNEIAIPKND